MVGFVQNMPTVTHKSFSMTEHEVACFYGEQETHYDMEKTVAVKTEQDTVKIAVITNQNKIETDGVSKGPADETNLQIDASLQTKVESEAKVFGRSRLFSKRYNAHHAHVATAETDKAISFINSNNFGWKANVCMLQQDHPQYGAHCNLNDEQALL